MHPVGYFERSTVAFNLVSVEGSEFGGEGGTNPCDAGLDLSGSWQQGHSTTYNAPSRI